MRFVFWSAGVLTILMYKILFVDILRFVVARHNKAQDYKGILHILNVKTFEGSVGF